MKIFFTLCFALLPLLASAQPVITDASKLAPVGYTAPVSVGQATLGVGAPGANQIWDFRSVALLPVGTQTVVAVSATPFAASYPAANYAFTITTSIGGTGYYYFIVTADAFQTLAANVTTGPGSGDDMTPNPETTLKFPFAYGETFLDTYQKVGSSPDSVAVKYDGYGTLMLSSGTYSGVVRVELRYPGGSDFVWYATNPVTPLLVYSQANILFTVFSATVAGVETESAVRVTVAPNPAKDRVLISVAPGAITSPAKFRLVNTQGLVVREHMISTDVSSVDLDGMARGTYFYQMWSDGKLVAHGGLAVE